MLDNLVEMGEHLLELDLETISEMQIQEVDGLRWALVQLIAN